MRPAFLIPDGSINLSIPYFHNKLCKFGEYDVFAEPSGLKHFNLLVKFI